MSETLFELRSDGDPTLSDQDPEFLAWLDGFMPGWRERFTAELASRSLLRGMLAEGDKSFCRVYNTEQEAKIADMRIKSLFAAWDKIDEIAWVELEVSGMGVEAPDVFVDTSRGDIIIVGVDDATDESYDNDDDQEIDAGGSPDDSPKIHRGYLSNIDTDIVSLDTGGYRLDIDLIFNNTVAEVDFAYRDDESQARNLTFIRITVPCNETSSVDAPLFDHYIKRHEALYKLEQCANSIDDKRLKEVIARYCEGVMNFYNYICEENAGSVSDFSAKEYTSHINRLGKICDQLIGERDCLGLTSDEIQQVNTFIDAYAAAIYTLLPTDVEILVTGWGSETERKATQPEKLTVEGLPMKIGLVKRPILGVDELALFVKGHAIHATEQAAIDIAAIPIDCDADDYEDEDFSPPTAHCLPLSRIKELDV